MTMKLRIKANVDHEDPEYWFSAYGAHISTAAAGDVCIQEIDPEWLLAYPDDKDLIAAHPGLPALSGCTGPLTDDECAELVALARTAWDAACDMHYYREMVVDAYHCGDLSLVEDRLEAASREERQYGDDPATRDLAKQLLEED